MLDYQEIGKNVRYYRTRAGLRQKELGTRANVTGDYISHIERGTTQLSLPVLVAIADALHLDVNSLLGICTDTVQLRAVDAQIADVVSSLPLEKRQMCLALCKTVADAPEFKQKV